MNRRMVLIGAPVLAVLLAAAAVFVWRPWAVPYGDQVACRAALKNHQPGQPICITWAQAKQRYPTWIRQPTWLPPGVVYQVLWLSTPVPPVTMPGQVVVDYQLRHQAWIQIYESTGRLQQAFPQRLNGVPVATKGWTVHNPGQAPDHLKQIAFNGQHANFVVLGMDVPWTDMNRVAATLLP